jgi:hypothetical protein
LTAQFRNLGKAEEAHGFTVRAIVGAGWSCPLDSGPDRSLDRNQQIFLLDRAPSISILHEENDSLFKILGNFRL